MLNVRFSMLNKLQTLFEIYPVIQLEFEQEINDDRATIRPTRT